MVEIFQLSHCLIVPDYIGNAVMKIYSGCTHCGTERE